MFKFTIVYKSNDQRKEEKLYLGQTMTKFYDIYMKQKEQGKSRN